MKSTEETDKFLSSSSLEKFNQYLTGDYTSEYKNLADYFNKYIGDHKLITSQIIKDSFISKDYAYQILSGRKANPSRDKVILLCLAMHMNLEETNRALKISKTGTLYSKDKNDAVIILCIHQKIFDVSKVNSVLYEKGLKTLTF